MSRFDARPIFLAIAACGVVMMLGVVALAYAIGAAQ